MSKTSSKLKAKPKVEKPVFSPEKSYTWQVDDVFAITGGQLDILNKVLNMQLSSPEVQKALALVEASKVVGAILREGVAEGIITEAPQEEPPKE